MTPRFSLKYAAIAMVVSIALGVSAIALVANSENAYAAGFLYFGLFLCVIFLTLATFIIGILFSFIDKKLSRFGYALIIAAFFLPLSFFVSHGVANSLGFRGYRNAPMEQLPIVSPR